MSLEALKCWRDPAVVEEAARPHYRDLPFHGFPHAIDTRNGVREIVQECIDAGEPIDPEEAEDAEIAAVWHDAGFYIPIHIHGYRSKEVYAAHVAATEQRALGMPEPRIQRMSTFILGTELLVPPVGRGGKAVRRADLKNVASGNPLFIVRRTVDLFNEDKILKTEYDHPGEVKTDLISFALGSYTVLNTYNRDDVLLGEFDVDENGNSIFSNRIDEGIQCFLPPQIGNLLRKLRVLAPKPGN